MSILRRLKPSLPAFSTKLFFILLVFMLSAATFLCAFYYFQIEVPKAVNWQGGRLIRNEGEWKKFKIKEGENTAQIAARLQQEGVIRSALIFRFWARLNHLDRTVKFGTYWVSADLSVRELGERFQQSKGIQLTFIEGWRREESASYAAKTLGNVIFEDEFLKASKGKEGYLFPDTYLIPYYIAAEELVDLLTKTFGERYQALLDEKGLERVEVCFSLSPQGRCSGRKRLSRKEVVTLASLVERETVGDSAEEMGVIAGILVKRWVSGWMLDVDATIQYALGYQEEGETWWKRLLTKEDLNLDSPFNTYKNNGLPPAPICNPSLAALKAVRDARPSSYWFYLHDSEGNVHYASTLEEHNGNVSRYLR